MKVNDNIFIQVASLDEEEARKEYKTRIADMGDDYIATEIPIDAQSGKLKRLDTGNKISGYFLTDGGVKNYFETEVTGFKQDVVRLVLMRRPPADSISRVQRRSFLRVSAQLEVAVRIGEHLQFVALTEDVGGGGTSFICEGKLPLKQNDKLSCWLLIHYRNGTIEHVPFQGEIVRVKPNPETGRQLVMLRFTEIAVIEQQKIIKFCFERQLEFRKQ